MPSTEDLRSAVDADTTEEWTNELRLRLQEVKDGTIELEDWDVVRARLADRRTRRP